MGSKYAQIMEKKKAIYEVLEKSSEPVEGQKESTIKNVDFVPSINATKIILLALSILFTVWIFIG